MAQVFFESDNLMRDAPDGSEIALIADTAGATIPFYCYEGACETCRVLVVEGMENLADINEKERQTLGDEKVSQGYRLGCQITLLSGRVVLRNGWEE